MSNVKSCSVEWILKSLFCPWTKTRELETVVVTQRNMQAFASQRDWIARGPDSREETWRCKHAKTNWPGDQNPSVLKGRIHGHIRTQKLCLDSNQTTQKNQKITQTYQERLTCSVLNPGCGINKISHRGWVASPWKSWTSESPDRNFARTCPNTIITRKITLETSLCFN
jgi:hypothetical protein